MLCPMLFELVLNRILKFTCQTGLCSPVLAPNGQYLSACYDSDYWDGNTYPTRFVPAQCSQPRI